MDREENQNQEQVQMPEEQNMPVDFEGASQATQAMFDVPQEETQPEQVSQENVQQPVEQQQMFGEEQNMPVQPMQQSAGQVNPEMQMLAQQIEDLKQTLVQQNEMQQQSIVEAAMQEQAPQMPTLDVDEMAFLTEEERQAKQAEYTQAVADYTRQQIMNEIQPFVDEARRMKAEQEKNQIFANLQNSPDFNGIQQYSPQIQSIINSNKLFQNSDMTQEERIINAYALARGVEAIKAPPPAPPAQPTLEEMMNLYNSNQEFRDAVEQQRIGAIKNNQQVPVMSASSGAANAALNIPSKPTTFEEARKRTGQMFKV